jgi:hypothetical protein
MTLSERIAAGHCRACVADRADIGTFDHGIPHTLDASCTVPRWAVDACGRTGNHVFHVRSIPQSPFTRRALAGTLPPKGLDR